MPSFQCPPSSRRSLFPHRLSLGALAISLGLAANACTGSSSDKLVEPQLNGKTDAADSVSMRGAISVGGEVTGSFDRDLQFDGYLFRVGDGAKIEIEIAHRGSAAKLDSTLLIYSEGSRGFGPSAIALDDDSGFAAKSKISGLVLEQGTYLAVVGTGMGIGRGHYRMTLTCEGDHCAPLPVVDGCPEEIDMTIRECVDEEQAIDPSVDQETAFDLCINSPFAGFGDQPEIIFEDLCTFDTITPDWCSLGVDVFVEELVPLCIEELRPELGSNPSCFEFDAICQDNPCDDDGLLPVSGAVCSDGGNCCI